MNTIIQQPNRMPQIYIQHKKRYNLDAIYDYTKWTLFPFWVTQKDKSSINELMLSLNNERDVIKDIFIFERLRRIFLIRRHETQYVYLVEVDYDKHTILSRCNVNSLFGRLVELPSGHVAYSLLNGVIIISSPDLQIEYFRQHSHVSFLEIVKSFQNGFIFVYFVDNWYRLVYAEFLEDKSILKAYTIASIQVTQITQYGFHAQENFFVWLVVKPKDNNNILWITYGWINNEDHSIQKYEENLSWGNYDTDPHRDYVLLSDEIFVRMANENNPNENNQYFILVYRLGKYEHGIRECARIQLSDRYFKLEQDTEDPRCFYGIKHEGVDHFRLIYPPQSLMDMCCYTLALQLDSSLTNALKTSIPQELLENTQSFLTHKPFQVPTTTSRYIQ